MRNGVGVKEVEGCEEVMKDVYDVRDLKTMRDLRE